MEDYRLTKPVIPTIKREENGTVSRLKVRGGFEELRGCRHEMLVIRPVGVHPNRGNVTTNSTNRLKRWVKRLQNWRKALRSRIHKLEKKLKATSGNATSGGTLGRCQAVPTSEADCRKAALAAGLKLGGKTYKFAKKMVQRLPFFPICFPIFVPIPFSLQRTPPDPGSLSRFRDATQGMN